jgi:hypothetical protein
MAWTIDLTNTQFINDWKPLTSDGKHGPDFAAQGVWDEFKNAVNSGQHPKTAGERMSYKDLNKATGQYQIELSSSGKRASFFVDEAAQRVHTIQVGGHT